MHANRSINILVTFALLALSATVGSVYFFPDTPNRFTVPEESSRTLLHDKQVASSDSTKSIAFASEVMAPTTDVILRDKDKAPEAILAAVRSNCSLNVSTMLHYLHLFGREAKVPLADGHQALILDLLLDVPYATKHLQGTQQVVRTRYGVRFPLAKSSALGSYQGAAESHPGQALAVLATLGVSLSEPIKLQGGECCQVNDLFADLLANFLLDGEIYWDAVAIAIYMSPAKSWKNKFGDVYTFDQLVDELIARPPAESSCAGTHGLIALATIMRVDRLRPILTDPARSRLETHLRDSVKLAVAKQHPDGAWALDWCESTDILKRRRVLGRMTTLGDKLVATGHHLEWITMLPKELLPEEHVMASAGHWLARNLRLLLQDPYFFEQNMCPTIHAVRSLEILCGDWPLSPTGPHVTRLHGILDNEVDSTSQRQRSSDIASDNAAGKSGATKEEWKLP